MDYSDDGDSESELLGPVEESSHGQEDDAGTRESEREPPPRPHTYAAESVDSHRLRATTRGKAILHAAQDDP